MPTEKMIEATVLHHHNNNVINATGRGRRQLVLVLWFREGRGHYNEKKRKNTSEDARKDCHNQPPGVEKLENASVPPPASLYESER
jgi:hypothetical protein